MFELIALSATILSIYTTILATGEEIRGNEKRCKRLIKRLEVFVAPLKRIESAELVVDLEALLRLQETFTDARDLVYRFSAKNWITKAVQFKHASAEFEEITFRLNTARDDLHFDMVVNKHAMEKEDKRDTEDDFEALQNHLESMMKEMMDQKERKDEARFEQLLGLLKSARLSADQEIIGFQEIDVNELKPVAHGALGEGSFGAVSRVLFHGRQVAMKSMAAEALLTQSDVQDLREEVKIHAKLHFPGIVQLLGACTVKPRLCLVMELAPHGSLFNVLHVNKTKISWSDRCACIWDIASAVAYLHSRKILHRDIKTPNVLVFENLRLKLCDFGLSKVKSATRVSAHTKALGAAGTVAWMSPEIHEGLKHTEAADIYSTAVVMSELITGQIPFPNMMQIQIARAVCDRKERPAIPPKSEHDPPLRDELIEVMERCWHADPLQRMSSNELRDTLCDIMERNGGDSRSSLSLGVPTRKEDAAGRVQRANSHSAVYGGGKPLSPADFPTTEPASAPATMREHWNDHKEPSSLKAIDPALPPPSFEMPTPPTSAILEKAKEQPKLSLSGTLRDVMEILALVWLSSCVLISHLQYNVTFPQMESYLHTLPYFFVQSGSMIDDLAALRELRRKPAELEQQIDFVLDVMRAYPTSVDVQENACASISTLCSQDTLTAANVGVKGGCDLVVIALQSFSGQPTILCKVLDAISRLCIEQSNRALFARMDISTKIVACMTATLHTENHAVQQCVCLAFANLSLHADVRRQLIMNGGCRVVIDAMKNHASIPAVQEYGLLVIQHVATTSIHPSSMIKTISGSRLAKSTSAPRLGKSLSNRAPISEVNSDLVSIREAGACEVVINAMCIHKSLVRVQTNACLALAALCVDVDNQTQLGALCACELVAAALNNKSIPQVQESALKAVIKLCEHNEANRVRFSNACGNVLEEILENKSVNSVVLELTQRAQVMLCKSNSGKLKEPFSFLKAGVKASSENMYLSLCAGVKGSTSGLSSIKTSKKDRDSKSKSEGRIVRHESV